MRRSHKILQHALASLLKTKALGKISIGDIAGASIELLSSIFASGAAKEWALRLKRIAATRIREKDLQQTPGSATKSLLSFNP